ncbi:MAG: bifunctional 4-hydroxy-2-oxoglutarate aldolase/2-dehydro-3-deoxy-phosphogluconate aldolase, partial [Candidatus Omnitrophota bacterium]
ADFCVGHNIPFFPGALTPLEIYQAWQAGAAMVKVFPAKFFGPAYFKEIKGPFADIALLACGGVTPETLPSYFTNGASAVAFGGSIFRREWLNPGGLPHIEQDVKLLIQAYCSLSKK